MTAPARVLTALACGVIGGAAAFVATPLPPRLLERTAVTSLRVVDRSGDLLRELPTARARRAVPLAGGRVPDAIRAAFLAAEDRRFALHPGVDPLALARSALASVRRGRIVGGASTIPQQLARTLVPRPRTAGGKLREALWALRLCAHLPRERVLLEYLDRVALGNDVIGVEAASQRYFARPAARLSVGQAALLAGMASAPARHDPYRHPERARRRMEVVLALMERTSALLPAEREIAATAPLDLVPRGRAFAAPHLTTHVVAERARGPHLLRRIETTLDPALQTDVESAVRRELAGLWRHGVTQAAVIVVDNASGEVLAYVGSADFFDERRGGQNDGVRARRQPGSTLKPFVYGLALARGWTAATLLSDVDSPVATPIGSWMPRNYDRRLHGPVRLRAALANSYNVPAVGLTDRLGVGQVLEVLRRAGFGSLQRAASHYGAGVVLGNGDVSLRELARAYRGLARGGVLEPLVEVRRAWDLQGRPVPLAPELRPRRFLDGDVAALVTDILSDEAARAPAFGLDNALRLPFAVAVKTGTSRAHVDNWTIGFTRERTVAVWAGNFDGRPMRGVSGVTGAGPIFRRVMLRAMRGIDAAPLVDPTRFEHLAVCALSGARLGPGCPGAVHERFLPGTASPTACAMHLRVGGRELVDMGPAFHAWARAEGLDAGPWPQHTAPREARRARARLLLPEDGDEYLLEPGIPADDQTIPVRAAAEGGRELELRVDGGAPTRLAPPFVARVPARPGRHRIELRVPGGDTAVAVARIRVR